MRLARCLRSSSIVHNKSNVRKQKRKASMKLRRLVGMPLMLVGG